MRTTTPPLRFAVSLAILFALNGCKEPNVADAGETGASETGVTGDGDGDSGDGDGDSGDGDGDSGDGDGDTTGDGDGDTSGSECGNGMVEAGETCDDGNTMSGDGCSSSCHTEGPIPCSGQIYACGDELDNDMDGKTDLDDPECISPCDDDEGTFKTSLPGQNNDCKSDCYFDSNSGGGDDMCEWNLQCDPQNSGAEIGCEYDPNFGPCESMMPPECLDFCVPLLPNGCDCFGCCEIDGQFVYLDGANCALDNLDGCSSCTFFENCNNPCQPEICEVCFGQDPNDLPPECDDPSCPDPLQPCTDSSECPESFWCQTGCCVPINIP